MREIILKVTLKVDDDVSVADAKEYALDALESMGGCRHPEDPFFSMQDRVKVVSYRRPSLPGIAEKWESPRVSNARKLRWEEFSERTWLAYCGQVTIAMIGERNDGTVYYQVNGVYTKWITKGYGDVGSLRQARLSVERAWQHWCEKAGLA